MMEIAPSILAADFNCLGEQLQCIEKNGVRVLHIDVMDGTFVPSISFGLPVIQSIRKNSKLFFDVHLMVQEPAHMMESLAEAGADNITVHVEACKDIKGTLEQLKKLPVQVGVSIKPATPVETIKPFLKDLDMVLIMSVEPGKGGQKLIPETLEKAKELKKLREENGYHYKIEMDGGINTETMEKVVESGVDVAVAGSAVFGENMEQKIEKLTNLIAECEAK